MSARLVQFLLVLTCGMAGVAAAQDVTRDPALSTEQLFERVYPSVCTIASVDEENNLLRRGSGFILKDSHLLVTNAHVIAGFTDAEVKCGDQVARIEEITNYDGNIDLVLARTSPLDVAGLSLSTRSDIRPGTQVYAFGSPYGLEGTISPGLTSVPREIMGQSYLQISTPISSGSSGGPVTDGTGAVIGVSVATLEVAQNINFALPASAINALPEVNLQPVDIVARDRRTGRREPPSLPESPELETDIASGGAAFRGFPFGASCGEIAITEYERKLPKSRRKGLTRFADRYAGTLEIPVDLLGIPATVSYTCNERFGMVRGHYEILGHEDSVPQIAAQLEQEYGPGHANPISEARASELGCRWNFSLPGSRHYRPSERTSWNIDERLQIDLITCGGTSNMTFVYYGDPVLAGVVERTEAPQPYDNL